MLKKLFCLLAVGILLVMTSCANQVKELDAPGNLRIEGNIVTFDKVEGAIKYTLVFNNMKRSTTETSVNIDTLNIPEGSYDVSVIAIGDGTNYNDSKPSQTIKFIQENKNKVMEIKEEGLINNSYIKWMGRTYFDEVKKMNMIYHSASGFEVTVKSSSVTATLFATKSNSNSQRPYVVIVVDHDFDNMKRVALTKETTELVLAQNLDATKEHTVTLYKSTESIDSHIALMKITTDGTFIPKIDIKEHKIEVIAASSSTGFGNLTTNPTTSKSTENSDTMQGFAAIVARTLDADLQIYAASGWGVKASAYTTPKTLNMFDAYKKVDMFSDVNYDFSSYTPDLVIINLGTNDYAYINQASNETEKAQRTADFKAQYMSLVEFVHAVYPNASILLVHGIMNENKIIAEKTKEIYNELKVKIDKLYICETHGDGKGASYHPSAYSHSKIAQDVVKAIKENLGW